MDKRLGHPAGFRNGAGFIGGVGFAFRGNCSISSSGDAALMWADSKGESMSFNDAV